MGYIPLGVACGLFAISQGFHWWWATVLAAIVYSGSMEFLAIGLIMGGVPLGQAALTTLFVNFRHAFYGLSFPLGNIRSLPGRLYGIHAMTDEAYALLIRPEARSYSGARILWTEAICQAYWVTGVTVGALVGTRLPWDLSWMGFALTALFVVLSIDVLRAAEPPWPLALIALACAGVALAVVPQAMMVVAMCAYAVIIVAAGRWLA